MNVTLNKNDEIVMKLLHYFITIQGYNPVVLHGAKDEIWLEAPPTSVFSPFKKLESGSEMLYPIKQSKRKTKTYINILPASLLRLRDEESKILLYFLILYPFLRIFTVSSPL